MYLLLELGPSVQSLNFGENVHVEIIYSEVRGHIWSVVAYMSDEEWMNLPLLPAGLDLGEVYCYELVREATSKVCRKSGASIW